MFTAKAIVQHAVVVDFGHEFVRKTYIIESKEVMVFVVETLLEELDEIAANPKLPSLHNAAQEAFDLISKHEDIIKVNEEIEDKLESVGRAEKNVTDSKKAIDGLFRATVTAQPTTSNRGGRRQAAVRHDYNQMVHNRNNQNVNLERLRASVRLDEMELSDCKEAYDEAVNAKTRWQGNNLCTIDDFTLYGKSLLTPAKQYYTNLFIDGEYKSLRKLFRGARVFDPIFVINKGLTLLEIQFLVELCMSNLGFPEFTPHFKQKVKDECLLLRVTYIENNFNFDSVRGADKWKIKKEVAKIRP